MMLFSSDCESVLFITFPSIIIKTGNQSFTVASIHTLLVFSHTAVTDYSFRVIDYSYRELPAQPVLIWS